MDSYFFINNEKILKKIVNAKWIWGGEDPRPINSYRFFRREFYINNASQDAEITIYAEYRYRLFINGEFVQVGPTPSRPEERLFDNYCIKNNLTEGLNCIGIEVYCPGLMTGQWTMVNPGLTASVSIDSGQIDVITDSSWKTIRADAWIPNTQLCPYAKGFYEYKDMTRYPKGWNKPGYNDSEWEHVTVIPFYSYSNGKNIFQNYVGYPTLLRHRAENCFSKELLAEW